MFQTKASQIFSRNKVAESKSKRNVLQMIRDVYEDTAVAHAELAAAMREIATARASAADDDEEEDYDLHSVDAESLLMTMPDTRLSLKSSICLPECNLH